ncbi:MAG TPA: hypothetical protein VN441_04170 [Syntrophomonas sp.]|nr:hypothetical protein [Syntrophomonas sp.]
MRTVLKWVGLVLLTAAVLGTAAVNIYDDANPQTIYRDTDANGYPEKYELAHHHLRVYENNHLIWESPDDWNIRQINLADADNDRRAELAMVLWKHGSYGEIKPFWYEGEDDEYTCHLFLYRMRSGRLTAVWCSSALVNPIIEMTVKASGSNGTNELHVLEGPPTGFAWSVRQLFHRQETRWVWNGWGFERAD